MLKFLPIFSKNALADSSVDRGFALVGNGETGITNPERQGLNSTITDGGSNLIMFFSKIRKTIC